MKVTDKGTHTMSYQSTRAKYRGLTLIEVLIATTLTLLMMLALAQGFKALSDSVSEGRAKINLSDQLRGIVTLLRADLTQRTTDGSTPQSILSRNGYFKYYDGGMSDFTATVLNRPTTVDINNPESVGQVVSASRYGDIDDILMFTAIAKDGEFFRGRIPRALLRYHQYNEAVRRRQLEQTPVTPVPPPGWPSSQSQWDEEWSSDVVITSKLAEIVWFMVPLNNLPDLTGGDSGIVGPADTGLDVVGVIDFNGDGAPDPDGIPDKMALCRRVLLIRDDLDIRIPLPLRTYITTPEDRQFYMQPTVPAVGSPLTFRQVPANALKRCDLSVSTEIVESSSGNMLVYRTNSLSSLQEPHNRFAHGMYPVDDGAGNVNGTTLPLMFLSNGLLGTLPSYTQMLRLGGVSGTPTFVPDGGFIPESFMRVRYLKDAAGNVRVVGGARVTDYTLEEIVCTNAVAFDLKAYDPSAPQLYHPGPDAGWGTALFDDDDSGNADDLNEAGWPGSDDLTVGPSDPGFWTLLAAGPSVEASRGGFVDMGWGFKGLGLSSISAISDKSAMAAFLASDYSGLVSQGSGAARMIQNSPNLYLSGGIAIAPNIRVFQCAFDTFTNAYDEEVDTVYLSSDLRYRAYPNGLRKYGGSPVSTTATTFDCPPPFASSLSSIQATIRVEDVTAGAIQQISIIQSLKD